MENLWEMIAKARGVELEEEFKWLNFRHKITKYDGLLILDGSWERSNGTLSFIKGYGEIEKLPFRPQDGRTFYSIFDNSYIGSCHWINSTDNYARLIAGIVFRTGEEAEAYLPIWQERINKL